MAREQIFTGFPVKTVASSGTPEQLQASSQLVKCVKVQALPTNTDLVFLGDASNQNLALQPGYSECIYGDNLDTGTAGLIDLAKIFVRVTVNGNGVSYTILNNQ